MYVLKFETNCGAINTHKDLFGYVNISLSDAISLWHYQAF